MAIRYKLNLPVCVLELLALGRSGCTGRDWNGETVGCR